MGLRSQMPPRTSHIEFHDSNFFSLLFPVNIAETRADDLLANPFPFHHHKSSKEAKRYKEQFELLIHEMQDALRARERTSLAV